VLDDGCSCVMMKEKEWQRLDIFSAFIFVCAWPVFIPASLSMTLPPEES
jgi:hypothetical protein